MCVLDIGVTFPILGSDAFGNLGQRSKVLVSCLRVRFDVTFILLSLWVDTLWCIVCRDQKVIYIVFLFSFTSPLVHLYSLNSLLVLLIITRFYITDTYMWTKYVDICLCTFTNNIFSPTTYKNLILLQTLTLFRVPLDLIDLLRWRTKPTTDGRTDDILLGDSCVNKNISKDLDKMKYYLYF